MNFTVAGSEHRERNHNDIVQALEPHPFILVGQLSPKLLPGYVGQKLSLGYQIPPVPDHLIHPEIVTATRRTASVITAIMRLRREFRYDIVQELAKVVHSTCAWQTVHDHLSSRLYLLKVSIHSFDYIPCPTFPPPNRQHE